MRGRFWTGLLLLLCGLPVLAAGPGAVRKQVESSMLVTGSIEVDANGKVGGFGIDHRQSLPAGILELIQKSVPAWQFEPVLVNGAPVDVKTTMGLRIVARKLDEDSYNVDIRSASFGTYAPGESVSSKKMSPPSYPRSAVESGVGGTVYLLLRVGKGGAVEDVIAEQVNLRIIANEIGMTRWRQLLEQSAVASARKWMFIPPQSGEEAKAEFWSVRVPVDYRFRDERDTKQGHWEAYVPGPRQVAPWLRKDELANLVPDALAAGGVYQVGHGLRLLTPLGAG